MDMMPETSPLIEAAQALEAERARPSPSSKNADDRLLDLFLANVQGDGESPVRLRQFKAMKRIVARLRRENSDRPFTSLLVLLLNNAANDRGWL